MGEINVVPYIDVMLVLLIIFMVTAPLLTQGVKVDLPKAAAQPLDPSNAKPLVLSINSAGALRKNPETQMLVRADRSIAYGMVIDVMVVLQQAGAKKVGLVTDPLPEPKQSKG